MVRAPHALAAGDVARELAGDLERGLSDAEVEERLARFGPNRLPRARRPAYATIALRQFADPLVGLLIGATVVSFVVARASRRPQSPPSSC
jgi:cation-transporting ATPase F